MNNFFNTDNSLWRWFSKIGDFLGLSLVWLLCSIPVLTIAPAGIALYDSVAHCVRGNEEGPYRRFFKTFRSELLRGIGISALWAVLTFLFLSGYNILYQLGKENQLAAIYSLVYAGTMLIPLGVFCWLLPIESRFTYRFGELHKTALVFAIAHLPTTGAILGILIAGSVITLVFPILLVLMPCIIVTLQAWLIEKVFKHYLPEEENDDNAV